MSVPSQPSSFQCEYQRLPNGIDQFTFLSNTPQAVDDYFACLDAYLQTVVQDDVRRVVRLLVVLKEPGMPPVSYMLERYLAFLRVHQDQLPTTRVVYLYQKGFMLSTVRAFLGLITKRKHPNRRFLHISERAQAEAWLLEG